MARGASRQQTPSAQLVVAAGLAVMAMAPGKARAQDQQDQDRNVPVLDLPREGYEAPTHHAGPFVLSATADARVEYDDNIFAQRVDRTSDVLITVRPAVKAKLDTGRISSTTEISGSLYRYVDQTSEDHDGYAISSRLAMTNERVNVGGRVAFERTFESRHEPEARRPFGTGPRLFTIGLAELFAGVDGNRTGLSARVTAERYNFLSTIDDERDFTSYQASLRARYRVSPLIEVFAQAFINWRDFRLPTDRSGINRDAVSEAGLVGVQFDPGGKIRGEIAGGIVHLNPKADTLKGYTGVAVRGSLVYQPWTRTAITLDAFRGDVATVRLGASGRVDTRVRLGIQQEAYHDVLVSGGVGWRKTQYRGVANQSLTTWAADGEAEYLLSRAISVAVTARYVKRTVKDNIPFPSPDEFARFTAGVELRFKL
jgi:hypothetical protein